MDADGAENLKQVCSLGMTLENTMHPEEIDVSDIARVANDFFVSK